ncbi:MsnO8 family LLM class oxidoreductase [Bacillaceae bacterium SIJ1]|uniref:MsnO8 family LLM class oxidoreductase n=1 Tax=Litoribacterium kuwaitense TaxID=1398745 RepID=UPI0013EC3CC7|nr:MsnO8 family LLM class oxidoreductase [Litoribacterium kuwaitense]NGP44667.1 MsnO8 family LLM class oxidoreductase [Litoribacterium kuwaitense]
MKLSILDLSPAAKGTSDENALQQTIDLAIEADQLGYERFWLSEHHQLKHIASASPALMIAAIGQATKQIRLGAGAVLLPLHPPYLVAETHRQLAAMFPDRIDLGIGRAPGAPPEVTTRLAGNFLEAVRRHPERLDELLTHLADDNIRPVPSKLPEVWLLGTGRRSAIAARERGLSYCFGAFMSASPASEAFQHYKQSLSDARLRAKTMIAVSVACVSPSAPNRDLALMPHDQEHPPPIVGLPAEVATQLKSVSRESGADELMIHIPSASFETRHSTIQHLADELFA